MSQLHPRSDGESVVLFAFDHDHGVPARELKPLLGGKGAGLAEMTRALHLPVPPGFTIPLPVSQRYRDGGWPTGLEAQLDAHMRQLGARMGRHFGDARDPLLVAVRSGAPVSMPGMLDTVLNLGLNDETVAGLAKVSGDPLFAWESYRRFVHMFATTVLGAPAESLEKRCTVGELEDDVAHLRRAALATTGQDVPTDPHQQLRRAIVAVFESWNSARARAYRDRQRIDEQLGTAVNVQAMVFGNRDASSGTGVVFTRNPSTGAAGAFGDYLPRAQGEDVVAGIAHTLPVAHLAAHVPAAHAELQTILRRLEIHYRDLCDVEFTVEQGRLWVLQTRTGKRSAAAAVKIAVDLVADPDIRLSPREAVERVPPELRARAHEELSSFGGDDGASATRIAVGLGASPGRASGRIALDSDAAADATEPVILVRPQTSPEDVIGMSTSAGILTSTGGLVSHAAVVAREWGIPAVVGARDVVIGDGIVRVGALELRAGDLITIDGTTGEVWRGVLADAGPRDHDAIVRARLPELPRLEAWAAEGEMSRRGEA
jgi:pyruvate,orthophosphate dikinase